MPATAETCASEQIMGRSEPSRYEWTAKAKARANWRTKVRALPGLGPDYSTWSRAINTEERCHHRPVRFTLHVHRHALHQVRVRE